MIVILIGLLLMMVFWYFVDWVLNNLKFGMEMICVVMLDLVSFLWVLIVILILELDVKSVIVVLFLFLIRM